MPGSTLEERNEYHEKRICLYLHLLCVFLISDVHDCRDLMSSSLCANKGPWCTQTYPVKDYFLALFVIVGCIVSLRMFLHAVYYIWLRFSSRRSYHGSDFSVNADDGQSSDSSNRHANIRAGPRSVASTGEDEQSICVIVAGEERPTFIAQPAPLAPLRISQSVVQTKSGEQFKI